MNTPLKEKASEPLLNKTKTEKKWSISIWRLLYHLSTKKEVFLMLLGTLGSIISAISGPIMSYNFGGAINDFQIFKILKKLTKIQKK